MREEELGGGELVDRKDVRSRGSVRGGESEDLRRVDARQRRGVEDHFEGAKI